MNKKHIYIILTVVAILLIPYFFKFPWTVFDYVLAAILISTTGLILEVVTAKIDSLNKKILVGVGILGIAVYAWAELAVGIFTNIGS